MSLFRKKTTNVSVADALLIRAKTLGVNVSQAAEVGLAKAVSDKLAEEWLKENTKAIASSNAYVEEHGLPFPEYRRF